MHTRFEHTLGVFHVTSLMTKVCKLEEEHARLVRLAALLHDLGHGPFSHVSEGALDIFLRINPELIHVLGKRTLSQVELLLAQGYDEPVLRSIISGPLDADKQDLQRDTYLCGVKYGVFDLQPLHRELEWFKAPWMGARC